MHPIRTALAGIALACCAAASATAEEYELANGLKVWLHPVRKAQHTAVVVVFDVGERNDPEGQSGLAHLVEHCLVTAADGDRPAAAVDAWAKAWPVVRNAQTGRDYTVLALVVKRERALEAVRWQAARMGSLKVAQSDLDREVPRLATELGNMFEHIPELAARNHSTELVRPSPKGARKGGVLSQVEKLTVEQVQRFWQQYYKPGNARLMIAGAFKAEELKKVIDTGFGAMTAAAGVPPMREETAPTIGKPLDVAVSPKQENRPAAAAVAVRAPEFTSRHFAPFCVALARLWDRQFTQRARVRVDVSFAPLDDPGVLRVLTAIRPGEKPAAAVKRIHAFIDGALSGEMKSVYRSRAKSQLALPFGTATMGRPEKPTKLYVAAFRHARLAQLGIDPGQLVRRLNAVIGQTFAKMRTEVFGADKRAVVTATIRP